MKSILSLTVLLFIGIHISAQKFHSIFDGKTLTGWKVPENNIWYTAAGGILNIQSSPEKKGSILWTEKEYSNFIFQTDFKMGDGTVDSGIFLRGENDQVQ
jgi:hypothetical protein